jgi:hypothetical protein
VPSAPPKIPKHEPELGGLFLDVSAEAQEAAYQARSAEAREAFDRLTQTERDDYQARRATAQEAFERLKDEERRSDLPDDGFPF